MSRSPKGVVQSLGLVWLFATPWTAAHQASLSSLSPGVCSNSCPLSWWCHPTTSVIPFSSRLQSFPESGSSSMSRLFASGGQSIAASVLASVLPVTIQGWFPLGLTGLNSLLSKGLSRVPFWLWLLLQLAAAFSAALSQLGLSPPFSASGSADLWIFKLSPFLWCLSPATHTVSCPFSVWHPHSQAWKIWLDWSDTTQDGSSLLGRAMSGHLNATCHPWAAAQMAWHLFLAHSFVARVMGMWTK